MPTLSLPANWVTGNSYAAGNQNNVETVVNTHTSKLAAVPVQPACRVATTGSETFTISAGSVTQISGTTIDGVSVSINDYVLVKDAPASTGTGSLLSSQPGNGIYQVTGNTTNISLSRAAQMSSTADAATPAGMVAVVEAGTVAGSSQWVVSSPNSAAAFTYGTTAMQWKAFASAYSSGVITPVQVSTTGAETYTISGGNVTQINGTTLDGYAVQVGDRVFVYTAPASSGAGTLWGGTTNPGNGVYTVTGNTTNLTLTRATDFSGAVKPAGMGIWVTSGSNWGASGWQVTTPLGSGAFTWGSSNIGFTPYTGANPRLNTAFLNNALFLTNGGYNCQVQSNTGMTAPTLFTLPIAPLTDEILTAGSTKAVTNKFITPRVGTTTSSATPSIACTSYDMYTITALAAAITSVTITGTPVEGQKLMVRIKDNGSAQTIAWGSSFAASGASALLTTTVASKTHLCSFMYDAVAAKWIATATDFNGY